MDIAEVVAQVKDTDAKDFAKALQEHAPDHYNGIFRIGYGTAKGEWEKKLEGPAGEIEALHKTIESQKAQITALGEKQPDLQKMQAQYEVTLEEKARLIEQLQSEKVALEDDFKGQITAKDKDFFRANLAQSLIAMGVDADYARIRTQDPEIMDQRVKVTTDGIKIYQSDLQTPQPISDGQKPHEVLAKDLLSAIPPKFIAERRPGSSGYQGPGQANGSTIRLTPDQARDAATYRQAKARADKEGKSIEVTP